MKLNFKQLNLESGRPIAFINNTLAKKLNVSEGGRIVVRSKKLSLILPVNLVEKLLSEEEISFSKEAIDYLNLTKGSSVEISIALETQSSHYILEKMNGHELKKEEIFSIVNDIVNNSLTEAEIAYFVSGVYHNGLTFKETVYLTEAMAKSGKILSWGGKKIADKHSIGGIPGNRTTPIVISICAAAGIIIPKTSSRAITTAAATADVMDVITNVSISASELQKIVKSVGACLAWGGAIGLAPADDKLIRVERMLNLDPEAQLIASILSKKIAAGSKYLLLDIPYGKGAKVSFEQAKKLKKNFLRMTKHFRIKTKIVLTDGSQPIGNAVGPVLEAIDLYKILKRENPPKDLEDKSIFLASQLLELMDKAKKGQGAKLAREILDSGKALKKFEEIISAQGKRKEPFKLAKYRQDIIASSSGKVSSIDNKLINSLGRILGCPTSKSAGMYLHKHVHDAVKEGDKIVTLYSESKLELEAGVKFFKEKRPYQIKRS